MEERIPADSGFVVEWQLADDADTDADTVIDLSMAEARVRQSDMAAMPPSGGVPIPR